MLHLTINIYCNGKLNNNNQNTTYISYTYPIYLIIYLFIFLFYFRLELHTESSNTKPELIFMDQMEEVSQDFVQFKNEQCIQIRFRDGIRDGRIILTNSVSFYLLCIIILLKYSTLTNNSRSFLLCF